MSTTIYSANYHPSSISLFHDSDGYYHLIYMIVNKINNKIYIGKHSTKNPYDDYMGSGKAINAAIKKYGLENFEKTILYCFDSEDKAYLKESEIVDETFVKRSDTYNMKCGGKGLCSYDMLGEKNHMYGKQRSEECKLKQSKTMKGRYSGEKNPMYGRTKEKHPRYGKSHSQDIKNKISKSKKGIVFSEEHKKHLSENHWDSSGKNNPRALAIQKIDIDGNIIAEYDYCNECCKNENINKNTLRKYIYLQKPYKNFYYRYKDKHDDNT